MSKISIDVLSTGIFMITIKQLSFSNVVIYFCGEKGQEMGKRVKVWEEGGWWKRERHFKGSMVIFDFHFWHQMKNCFQHCELTLSDYNPISCLGRTCWTDTNPNWFISHITPQINPSR